MRQRKYDYELIVQLYCTAHGWEDIETVQTDSNYYLNLDYRKGIDPVQERYADKYAKYLKSQSALAYGANTSFRIIRRRTKKGAAA